jgi:hypothetical protein
MKAALHLFFSFLSILAFGQASYLEPDNPAPRVGEAITVTAYFEKENLRYLEEKRERSADEDKKIQANRVATASIKINQELKESGPFVIGPLELTFNGVTYKTQPLTLQVNPALPDKVSDGVWIRTTEFNGAKYLIVEQRIANKWKKEVSNNAITLSTEDVTYVEFDQDKFEANGIEVVSSRSSSHTQQVDKEAGHGAGSAAYKIAIYKYIRTPEFKGPFQIDKRYFSNLPKGAKLESVAIQ